MMTNNLNKPDFWDPLKEIAPDAVDYFCKWIDEFKMCLGWGSIFQENVKFHDLPIELQIGIIARFKLEMSVPEIDREDASESASKYFVKSFRAQMVQFQHNLENKKITLEQRINREQSN